MYGFLHFYGRASDMGEEEKKEIKKSERESFNMYLGTYLICRARRNLNMTFVYSRLTSGHPMDVSDQSKANPIYHFKRTPIVEQPQPRVLPELNLIDSHIPR